ncbi:hypothetical protein HDV04_006209 [Boothiomyces sp. JEL0838]|nr:hypothetical protein HDV04_000844 [Boothiomyces sp. JEL0838]KAJ3309370.1 hypothetical protein HDV04_006209 [Boothiomyces sp. JEL0838]
MRFGKQFYRLHSTNRVVVGLSGGVDSTVSALLLKAKGYDVHGVYMKNWDHKYETGNCQDEYPEIERIANRIGIPITKFDFTKEYWTFVFDPFLQELMQKNTPNPDISCNQYIKFGLFYERAVKELNADYIAFGHYASIKRIDGKSYLAKALDKNKDQTYYLSHIKSSVLEKTIFPVGEMLKSDVKLYAKNNGLEDVALKKESMGICFIGKRNFNKFIMDYIPTKQGSFVTKDGDIIGTFQDLSLYTVGQGARIPSSKKWFVGKKDIDRNEIIVVERGDEMLKTVRIQCSIWWINKAVAGEYYVKYRYRMDHIKAKISLFDGYMEIHFSEPQEGVAVGQSVAIYDDVICYGGGIIKKVFQVE